MHKYWMNRLKYSPLTPIFSAVPGEGEEDDDDLGGGGGSGGGNEGDEDAIFGFDNEDDEGNESDDDDELTGDSDKLLSEFWKAGEDEGDDEESDEAIATKRTAQQKELADTMEAELKGFNIPEELIPDDFNPSDPKQMRKFMSDIGQHIARQTIRTMFKPVQAGFGSIVESMRREMQRTSSEAVDTRSTEEMLQAAIPSMNKPGVRPMVDSAFAQAKKRFPGDKRKQVIATKKALAAVGIRTTSQVKTGGSNKNRSSTGGAATGASALDFFAPLPKPMARSERTQERFRSNGR